MWGIRARAGARLQALTLVAFAAIAGGARAAFDASPGYTVSPFATGFAQNGGIGPVGLAFSPWNTLFVTDVATQSLYEIPAGGGRAGAAVNSYTGTPHGLAFDGGRLYMAITSTGDDAVWEVDPADGSLLRKVANVPCPVGLAVDPATHDLFVSSFTCSPNVWRISAPATASPAVTPYATGFSDLDGLTFGPDGTLWGADRSLSTDIVRIGGTRSAAPGQVTPVAQVPSADGIAVQAGAGDRLIVNRTDGVITAVDATATPPALAPVMTNGTRGDLVAVGPDRCAYATQSESILKVRPASGCDLTPTNPAPPAALPAGTAVAPSSPPIVRRQAAAAIIRLPSASRCTRGHRLRIRIVRRPGVRVLAVMILIDHHVTLRLRASRLSAPIDLRGLPNRAYTVTVRLVLSTHTTISASRRYRACRKGRIRA